MDKIITETLEIRNFFSINYVKWDIKRFNIITGDMGAGKSLCIKLLKFFEDIIPNLLILPYDSFVKNLDTYQCFPFIVKEFTDIFDFHSSLSNKQQSFKIEYQFSFKEQIFKMDMMCIDNNIHFESSSLEKLLKEWYEYLDKKGILATKNITPDGFEETKQSLFSTLLQKFGNYFPIATTFIPASRATLAFVSSFNDDHLKEFKRLIDVLPRFENRGLEIINTILKAKIKIENGSLFLESEDGRKVHLSKASSGQQEIVYLLMLLDRLGNFRYSYGSYQSIYIEEPEAQIFPLNQKQVIELIVEMFNMLNEHGSSVRYFITTHSPYMLNALNNILQKGALLEKYKNYNDKINKTINIPYLYANEVSAHFLSENEGWENMLDPDENYLNADKIAAISYAIDNVSTDLSLLKNELLSEGE
jgi:hypothetical protein